MLKQLVSVLGTLSPEIYHLAGHVLKCGSVGGHVRHCIEFYQSYTNRPGTGLVDYDARPRNLELETDPIAAGLALRRLLPAFEKLTRTIPQETALKVRECGATWLDSTHGRERRFLFSHTIHHMALIAVLLRSAKIGLCVRFAGRFVSF